jgi:hypothetical protein
MANQISSHQRKIYRYGDQPLLAISAELARQYDVLLDQGGVLSGYRPHLKKWLRFYLDFCQKYTFEPADGKSLPHFDGKLQEKGQADWMRRQAQQAVSLYYEWIAERNDDASTRVAAPPPPAGVGKDTRQCGDNAALRRRTAGRSPSTGAAPPAAMHRSVPLASAAGPMAETYPLSSHAVPGPTALSIPGPRICEIPEAEQTPRVSTC